MVKRQKRRWAAEDAVRDPYLPSGKLAVLVNAARYRYWACCVLRGYLLADTQKKNTHNSVRPRSMPTVPSLQKARWISQQLQSSI